MLMSIPLYFAAASRPRVLQLGPAERTTIFWNCGIQVKRAENKIVASGLLKEWEVTHPESGDYPRRLSVSTRTGELDSGRHNDT